MRGQFFVELDPYTVGLLMSNVNNNLLWPGLRRTRRGALARQMLFGGRPPLFQARSTRPLEELAEFTMQCLAPVAIRWVVQDIPFFTRIRFQVIQFTRPPFRSFDIFQRLGPDSTSVRVFGS